MYTMGKGKNRKGNHEEHHPDPDSPRQRIVQRDGKNIAYLTRDRCLGSPSEGLWEVRPVHDALTVGKSFPLFETRREAVEHVANNY